jgi:hypothetical protein
VHCVDIKAMRYSLSTILRADWPRLGWLAELSFETEQLLVTHGPYVLVDPSERPGFVAACVWDGPFEQGGFHASEHVFGSGVAIADGGVWFVPPSTTLERLVYVRERDRIVVSNSLPILLASIGAKLSTAYDYGLVSASSGFGINDYIPKIPIAHPSHEHVTQVIYDSLVVRGTEVSLHRRSQRHRFAGVGEYLSALADVAAQLVHNARSPVRQRSVRVVSNVSRGYGSPAVTALISRLARVQAYVAAHSNTRIPRPLRLLLDGDIVNDDGSDIARMLGTEPCYLDEDLRRIDAELERWLWASGQLSPELVFWRLFEDAERSDALTLWFAGHFAGELWDLAMSEKMKAGEMTRALLSGCSLSEARIRYGIIDCSIGYCFAEDAAQIHELSSSEAMKPWRSKNGYDRPIARHVLEQRGVPRRAFGFGRKAVAQDFDTPQGVALAEEFSVATGWSAAAQTACRAVNLGIYLSRRSVLLLQARGERERMWAIDRRGTKHTLNKLGPRFDLRRQTFVHCVNTLAQQLSGDFQAILRPIFMAQRAS